MDNMLVITGFIAPLSICLMLWNIMTKKIAKRYKSKLPPVVTPDTAAAFKPVSALKRTGFFAS
jgi:hypothetical protein